jgi:hypothetical protein
MTDKLAKTQAAFAVDSELVAASLISSFDSFCNDLKKSTDATTPGTNAQLNHLKAALDYRFKMVDALQSLGLLPKNLGNTTKTEFIYKTHFQQLPGGKEGTPHESPEDTDIRARLEAEYNDEKNTQ